MAWRAYFLSLKAEALHFADRTSEALEMLNEAIALIEASGALCWSAPFYRLRGVFLSKLGADELKLRKRSAGQSGPRKNKSRFPGRSVQKRPTRNITSKKRMRQEKVDSYYLFARR
jgi:hypothetical protein